MRPLDEFRSYLRVLAQAQLSRQFRRHFDASDIVQQTLLEAHEGGHHFRGNTPQEQMAWLRRILARNLADEIKRLRRKRRDIGRERPMQETAYFRCPSTPVDLHGFDKGVSCARAGPH